jgi:hypothetical protein
MARGGGGRRGGSIARAARSGGRGGARSAAAAVRNPGNGSTTFKGAGAVPGKVSPTGSTSKNAIRRGLPNGAGAQSANWQA